MFTSRRQRDAAPRYACAEADTPSSKRGGSDFIQRNLTQRRDAFTMLDVMLGVGIFSLLVVVMLTLVEKSLETTTILAHEHQQDQQRRGFLDMFRSTLRTLPGDVQMVSRRATDSSGFTQQQIVFANAPGVFAWGSVDEMLHSSVVLGQPQKLGGTLTFALKRHVPPDTEFSSNARRTDYLSLVPQENSAEDTAKWLTLLENIKTAQWRFYDPRTAAWLDDWSDPNTRPSLVELSIQFIEEETPTRYVFWVPMINPQSPPQFSESRGTNSGENNPPPSDTQP